MKKILTMLSLYVCALAAWASGPDAVSARLEGKTLKVALENATDYVAFQMDIDLPDGITAEAPAMTARLTDNNFVLAYSTVNAQDNVVRVLAYNLANNVVSGTSGDVLFTMNLSATGSEPITVRRIIFADTAPAEATMPDTEAIVAGDVNHSGALEINDLIGLVDIILEKDTEGLDIQAADVNGDGIVNINDLIALVDLILTLE